jgi:PAS domain S-box-containing protein
MNCRLKEIMEMNQKIKIGTHLNVLFLEDNPKDAEVCRELIMDSGYNLYMDITATEKEFESFLRTRKYDVILSDFKLHGFDGFGALRLCNKICPEVPFICVSGTIGEETAVELLKLGAVDYILKDKLKRLPFAIKKAIDEAKEKESRQKAEILLAASEMQYRRLFESAKDGILILNVETGKIVDVNPFLIDLLGYSKEELLEKEIWEIGFFKNIVANKDKFIELQQKEYVRYEDLPLETSDGRKINVEFVSNVYSVDSHKVIQCNIRDTTEQKHAKDLLKESEEQYKIITKSTLDVIFILNKSGKLLFFNESVVRVLGYKVD